MTTENSADCVSFLIKYGDFVEFLILIALSLPIIVEIEWDFSRLVGSVNYPTGFTVPAVCHSDR